MILLVSLCIFNWRKICLHKYNIHCAHNFLVIHWCPIMINRQILFIRELQITINGVCDACHENKVLEYLAMDEGNDMFTICKECCECIKKISDVA